MTRDTPQVRQAFDVVVLDHFTGVEDFYTVEADSEEEAKAQFNESIRRDDRQEIIEVEEAYSLNITRIRELMDVDNLDNVKVDSQ